MKQDLLTQMYGTTPESFKDRVALALQKTQVQPIKRKHVVRTTLVAAAIVVLCMAVAYAMFSSQVTAYFGQLYGNHMQSWLEKGDVATPNQSFTLDQVTFTLEEVVYRDNGLFGMGTIRPGADSAAVIIPEDHAPDAAYGYDVHGAGGRPEEAPPGAPTIADIVREQGRKLLVVRAIPDQIGVDGSTMLSPVSIGYGAVPQRDGSLLFSFEVSDATAVQAGETYTLQMWVSVCEMTPEGKMLEDTRHGENWTVDIKPTPLTDIK